MSGGMWKIGGRWNVALFRQNQDHPEYNAVLNPPTKKEAVTYLCDFTAMYVN
jgi:hypothetical protein